MARRRVWSPRVKITTIWSNLLRFAEIFIHFHSCSFIFRAASWQVPKIFSFLFFTAKASEFHLSTSQHLCHKAPSFAPASHLYRAQVVDATLTANSDTGAAGKPKELLCLCRCCRCCPPPPCCCCCCCCWSAPPNYSNRVKWGLSRVGKIGRWNSNKIEPFPNFEGFQAKVKKHKHTHTHKKGIWHHSSDFALHFTKILWLSNWKNRFIERSIAQPSRHQVHPPFASAWFGQVMRSTAV